MTPDEVGDSVEAQILAEVERRADALVRFASDLVKIPTVNPPGVEYERCAERIASELRALGATVEFVDGTGRPGAPAEYPRPNVVGRFGSERARPCVHLNGHFDVVPPGEGWSRDPFSGAVEGGHLHGRGSADMKAGLAAAVYAAAAVHEVAGTNGGAIELSGTVDEESGGLAGVAWLCEQGIVSADRTDHVIIPEPFGVDRICVGHRGVYWFRVTARGRTAHGSMPFLGRSAIDDLTVILDAVRTRLVPRLAERVTTVPVVPEGARVSTINVNAVQGGQRPTEGATGPAPMQSPCVADFAEAVFDRRFIAEEAFEDVRQEIVDLLEEARAEDPERTYELEELLVVHPTHTPHPSAVTDALEGAIERVVGRPAQRVASPGTYDHKHFDKKAGVTDCVAYGPGMLEMAHQPDESCSVEAIVTSAKVMALASWTLLQRSIE